MLCNCKIKKGQRYYRQTCVYDDVYDFIEHEECYDIANELDMYDGCDGGLNDETFTSCLDQYIYDNYPEEEADSLDTMSCYDKVCRVLEDIERQPR